MAVSKSTLSARPSKPYPDFPLTPRADGRWCKRIRGKLHYFTGTWREALDEYERIRDDLYAGREPGTKSDDVTVRDVVNSFLTFKEHLVETGELKPRSFNDYKITCGRIVKAFGRTRSAADLRPEDFAGFRRQMAKTLNAVSIGNEINRVRCVFKYAYDQCLLDKPIRYGQGFKRPTKKTLRILKAEKTRRRPSRPTRYNTLIDLATPQMRAMVLLAINAGLGNNDVGQMKWRHVDIETGWLHFPRPKTGIDRRAKLWRETTEAIAAISHERSELVFVTKYGNSWSKDSRDNPVAKAFRKLLDQAGIKERGIGFYRFATRSPALLAMPAMTKQPA